MKNPSIFLKGFPVVFSIVLFVTASVAAAANQGDVAACVALPGDVTEHNDDA